LAKCFGKK